MATFFTKWVIGWYVYIVLYIGYYSTKHDIPHHKSISLILCLLDSMPIKNPSLRLVKTALKKPTGFACRLYN